MKRIINLTILVCLVILPLSAQWTIEQYYVDMPELLDPSMTQTQRQELMEYYKADLGDSIANRFDNYVHVVNFDNAAGFIEVKTTDISTLQLKLLQIGNDTVMGMIKTVCVPICQSTIEFYNTDWQKRADIKFVMPDVADWLSEKEIKSAGFDKRDVLNVFNTKFISLNFDAENNGIVAQSNSLDFLDKAQQETYAPFLRNESISYRLENKRWVRND